MANDAALIQRFVACFTRLDEFTFSHDEPPPQKLSAGIDPDDWNAVRWQPAAIATPANTLVPVRRVGALPCLYEQLVLSYRWLQVDLQLCRLLPNLPADDLKPLADAMFDDPVLNATLIPNGFSRFALAPNECYDPICFDLNRFANDDCPVVRLNHESILMHSTVGEVTTVFGSFRELVHAVLAIDTSP